MKKIIIALAAAMMLMSCGTKEPAATTLEGFALGTFYNIIIKGAVPEEIEPKLDSLFYAADNSLSVFNPNSLLSRLNRNETDIVDKNIADCLDIALRVGEMSGGKYDITVLPLVEAYGFGAPEAEAAPDLDSLLAVVGYKKIHLRGDTLVKDSPGVRIDLNSVAKGYTVDMVAQLLDREGVEEYLVNIGGEVFCRGTNAVGRRWLVGIETPYEGNYIQGASTSWRLAVSGVGVATSGNYRNFHMDADGKKYTHIIDPQTGQNTESRLLSASAVASTCALADAYGTMFIALGFEESLALLGRYPEMAALLIYSDDAGEMKIFTSQAMKPYLAD